MKEHFSRFNHAFASGAIASLAISLLLAWFSASGLLRSMDILLRIELTMDWLIPRIFWGALLGILLLVPVMKTSLWKRALLFSLVPTTLEFFISYPASGVGNMALKAGVGTPFLILFLNFWGCVLAIYWAKKTGGI